MKSLRIFICLVTGLFFQHCSPKPESQPEQNQQRTLLAIFAHPDDESSVAPVLAKYAAEGVNVYLCIATDGRLGVNDHAKIPAGDSLAEARSVELQCAAEKLGIHPPIMFGLHDQLKMGESNIAFNTQMDSLRKGVIQLFNELKPDVVITWGASGWTGHHDHRLVNAVVTEVFESQAWDKPSQLFYAAIPTGSLPKESGFSLATVDKKFLTVTIPVNDVDYARSKDAWLCHKSQYTPETVENMFQTIKSVMQTSWYFQPHTGDGKPRQTLF